MATFEPDQLRFARDAMGLTQQRAAGKLGVSQAYLALMETGRRRVPAKIALKMMDLYHMGPAVSPFTSGQA